MASLNCQDARRRGQDRRVGDKVRGAEERADANVLHQARERCGRSHVGKNGREVECAIREWRLIKRCEGGLQSADMAALVGRDSRELFQNDVCAREASGGNVA